MRAGQGSSMTEQIKVSSQPSSVRLRASIEVCCMRAGQGSSMTEQIKVSSQPSSVKQRAGITGYVGLPMVALTESEDRSLYQ